MNAKAMWREVWQLCREMRWGTMHCQYPRRVAMAAVSAYKERSKTALTLRQRFALWLAFRDHCRTANAYAARTGHFMWEFRH